MYWSFSSSVCTSIGDSDPPSDDLIDEDETDNGLRVTCVPAASPTVGYNRGMAPSRPELTVLFTAVAQFSASLRNKLGTEAAGARLQLMRELGARLPRKYLLTASREEILAAAKTLIGEGRTPDELRTVHSTLGSLFDELVRAGALPHNPLREADPGGTSRGAGTPPEVLLAVRLPAGDVEKATRLLEPMGIAVHAESSHQDALDSVAWFPFGFILSTVPSVAPIPFLQTIRAPGSLCRSAGVILLAKDHMVKETTVFIGRGANRVVAVHNLETHLPDIVTELGMVSERTKVRLRVHVDLDGDRRSELWHCENISATGMLVRTQSDAAKGAEVKLHFTIPGDDLPIHASAVVVRGTTFAREDFPGLAVRFLSFVGEGQHRLAMFLGKRLD